MLIGELSNLTGVSKRSLRYWEAQDLLTSSRGSNGYREYGADATARVGVIRSLLDIGLPTAVIGQVLPCTGDDGPQSDACPALLQRIAEIRDDLDNKARTITAHRDALTDYLARASGLAADAR